MKRSGRLILSAVLLFSGLALGAQNLSDLRIGEVLVENTNGLTDGYGQRTGWIEIFNNSYGSVKFAGCYLSDDKDNLRKYHIPASDSSAMTGAPSSTQSTSRQTFLLTVQWLRFRLE